MEIWKDIKGYEGKYQVSNLGNVKSLHDRYGKERILKPIKDKDNYFVVNLCKDGKRKTCKVHKLVAEAFIPKIPGKEFVDHINGIRNDNRIDNLRWCTHQENDRFPLSRKNKSEAQKGKHIGKKNHMYGKTGTLHHSSKAVLCIEMNKIFGSVHEVERELGINNSHISMCCNGKRKSAGNYHWRYVD